MESQDSSGPRSIPLPNPVAFSGSPPAPRATTSTSLPERTRIGFDVDEDLAERARIEAAKSDQSVAALAREALVELLERKQQEREQKQADFTVPTRDTKARKQERFLKAIERRFFTRASCKLANVGRDDVRSWLKDDEFVDRLAESQEVFIETMEQKLLRMGLGKIKGNFMALIAWLNAHHPQFGRIKVELLSQVLGAFLEKSRKTVLSLAGPKLGEKINKALTDEAEKQLARFSE